MSFFQLQANAIELKIHVQPNASRERVMGLYGDKIKVALKSPPEDGKANSALVALFAEILALPLKQVELLSGHKSRAKILRITGLSKSELLSRLGMAEA